MRWQRLHAISVPGWAIAATGAGGMFTVTFTGQPTGGTLMPRAAAIPAAWIALNSRTRPGIKKHSTIPRTDVMPVQKKQQ